MKCWGLLCENHLEPQERIKTSTMSTHDCDIREEMKHCSPRSSPHRDIRTGPFLTQPLLLLAALTQGSNNKKSGKKPAHLQVTCHPECHAWCPSPASSHHPSFCPSHVPIPSYSATSQLYFFLLASFKTHLSRFLQLFCC